MANRGYSHGDRGGAGRPPSNPPGGQKDFEGPPPSAQRGSRFPGQPARGPSRGYDDRGRGRGGFEQSSGPRGYDDRGRGRGGFEQSSGPSRGYNDRGRGRGGFDQSSGPSRGYNDRGRGRGGFDQSRLSSRELPSAQGDVILPPPTLKPLNTLSPDDLVVKMTGLSVQGCKPPVRPDFGSVGRSVNVRTNCWEITVPPVEVNQYYAEVEKTYRNDNNEVPLPPRDKDLLIKHILNTFDCLVIHDGRHNIYSMKPLKGVGDEFTSRKVPITSSCNGIVAIVYKIKRTAVISTQDAERYIQDKKCSTVSMPQDCLRFLDCLLKNIAIGTYDTTGRSFLFEPKPVKTIVDKLFSIHKGFIASVRPQWKVRINVDMTCKAFFVAGNLADVLYEKYGDRMVSRHKEIAYDLRKIRVETTPYYKNQENSQGYSRRYTVYGVTDKSAADQIIPDLKQTVEEYYAKVYDIKLQYPYLPCIVVNRTRPIHIPMELLKILPYQVCNAKQSDVASEVIRCAAVRPADRFQQLVSFVKQFCVANNDLMQEYKVQIASEPTIVQARVLPTPSAIFRQQPVRLNPGKWIATGFHKTISDDIGAVSWAVLSVDPERYYEDHQKKLLADLPNQAARFNLKFNQPLVCKKIRRDDLKTEFEFLQSKGVRLVIFILYDDLSYPTIKCLGDIWTGLRTQCVRGRTLTKPNVIPNLLLKINGKLGGVNWKIPDVINNKELFMVFGADVTHPSPTHSKHIQVSIAAVTGSVTPDLMRYAVVVCDQQTKRPDSGQVLEIVADMKNCVQELIETYGRNTNGRLPTRLIFYRDGVSEGQFEDVLKEELPQIQRACLEIRQDYQPGITYIVVQKRHHIRLIPTDSGAGNVAPGTIVDTGITHTREFDFYLCSQEGIQGTSKPAHYHVLYDDSDWRSDALQLFTYHLCHTYMRCSRSVSYPAPTYYAHLAAFRARDWLAASTREELITQDKFKIHDSQKSEVAHDTDSVDIQNMEKNPHWAFLPFIILVTS